MVTIACNGSCFSAEPTLCVAASEISSGTGLAASATATHSCQWRNMALSILAILVLVVVA
ncbi:MAG: hypothetical protein ACYDGY_01610 [Acidimicrobiales bacterium]